MRDRLVRDGYLIVAAVFVGLRLFQVGPWAQGVDAFAYWATRSGDWYGAPVGGLGAYLYSPAFAQVLAPFVWLPWPIFLAGWTALLFAAHWWLAGWWSLVLLLFIPIPFEIVSGNIHLLIAAAIVIGFRFPVAWAFVLLTKVTPGIGLLWFAVRREWRHLGIALGATAAIVAVSLLLDAAAWRAWIDVLTDAGAPLVTVGWSVPIPLVVRLPVAVAVIVWGAWTSRRWTMAVAVTLALPVIWVNGLSVLDALVPLVMIDRLHAVSLARRPPALAALGATA